MGWQQMSNSFKMKMRNGKLVAVLSEIRSKKVFKAEVDEERQQRYAMFQIQNKISLGEKDKPKLKRTGIFQGLTFCFPLVDHQNDPSPDSLLKLANGIYSQGGTLIQFRKDFVNKQIKYILIDKKTDIALVREHLKGKMMYLAIIDYQWIQKSLLKFSKLQIAPFNLQTHYKGNEQVNKICDTTGQDSLEQIQQRIKQNNRKRAIRPFAVHTDKNMKKLKLNDLGEMRIPQKPRSKLNVARELAKSKLNCQSQTKTEGEPNREAEQTNQIYTNTAKDKEQQNHPQLQNQSQPQQSSCGSSQCQELNQSNSNETEKTEEILEQPHKHIE